MKGCKSFVKIKISEVPYGSASRCVVFPRSRRMFEISFKYYGRYFGSILFDTVRFLEVCRDPSDRTLYNMSLTPTKTILVALKVKNFPNYVEYSGSSLVGHSKI